MGYIVSARSGLHKILYGEKRTRFRVVFVWKIDFIITFLKTKSLLLPPPPSVPNLELILWQYFNQSNSLSSVLIPWSRNLGKLSGKVYIMYYGILAIMVNLIIFTRMLYITLCFASLGTEPRDSLYRYYLNS